MQLHKPSYKVNRHGNGLYSATVFNAKGDVTKSEYITRLPNGKSNVYRVKGAPLLKTLRDAVLYVVTGDLF